MESNIISENERIDRVTVGVDIAIPGTYQQGIFRYGKDVLAGTPIRTIFGAGLQPAVLVGVEVSIQLWDGNAATGAPAESSTCQPIDISLSPVDSAGNLALSTQPQSSGFPKRNNLVAAIDYQYGGTFAPLYCGEGVRVNSLNVLIPRFNAGTGQPVTPFFVGTITFLIRTKR